MSREKPRSLRVVAHGVDITPVDRIERLLDAHGPRFLARVFTQAEAEYTGAGRRRAERLAARFAAKEAALKALGTGWSHGIAWTDIETVNDAAGAPMLRVTGAAAEHARRLGIDAWCVSLSHAAGLAIASVIAGTAEP